MSSSFLETRIRTTTFRPFFLVFRVREKERESAVRTVYDVHAVCLSMSEHTHIPIPVFVLSLCVCTYGCVEGTKRTRFTLARTLLREWLKDSLPDPSSSFSSFSFSFLFFPLFFLSFHVTPRRRSNVKRNLRFFTLRRINLLQFRATGSYSSETSR